MRDLGLMGENTFSLWCADTGLIPNGSQIDKTGWDFFVEFPFYSSENPYEIHNSAIECKVQVKATDKNDRKLPITLSNLRRLITAQMPAFFVFIEFDGTNSAKRAFIVHIDNDLISKVLKRLHELEQSDEANNYNKRKMTIHYDDSHIMQRLDGECLKNTLLRHIGKNMAEYIAKKKAHLESTGFEDGFAQISFATEGEDNLKKLIDVSIGVEKSVDIAIFKGTHTRFGIAEKSPFVDSKSGKLEMPNLKPNAEGLIRFKENKLSPGLSFKSRLYISPFNAMVPKELWKMRVEGDFFDLKFNPYTGSANYSFSFGGGVRLEIRSFRDAIKLLSLLGSSAKKLFAELIFKGFPKLEFQVGCSDKNFDFSKELNAIESAVKLLSEFDVTELVDTSFEEISRYSAEICQMESMLGSSPGLFKVEFGVDGEGFDSTKEAACIFLVTAPIGSHIFGAILVLIGSVGAIEKEQFRLITEEVVIEKKIISAQDDSIRNEDLVAAIEEIEKKYVNDYSVVTMFDKKY